MNISGYKQCKVCPYLDKAKSTLHNENGRTVNPMNKPFCKLVDDWVDETTKCEGLAKIESTEYELKCNAVLKKNKVDKNGKEVLDEKGNIVTEEYLCNRTLVYFHVKTGEKGSIVGLMNLIYTPALMAYRPRKDGLMGFECICGHGDTRLSKIEYDKNPEDYPVYIKTSDSAEAKFNDPKSTLEALIVNKEK